MPYIGAANTTLIDYKASITETDILLSAGYAIPGGTLGANGAVRCKIGGDLLNNTGAGQAERFRVYWGGAAIFDLSQSIAASANRLPINIELTLKNLGLTNSQHMTGSIAPMNAAATVAGIGNPMAAGVGGGFTSNGALAIDTTAQQTLRVTWLHAANNALLELRIFFSIAEIL